MMWNSDPILKRSELLVEKSEISWQKIHEYIQAWWNDGQFGQ